MPFLVLKNRESTYNKKGNKFKYKHKTVRNNMSINTFFSGKIIQNTALVTAKEGLYTWILRSSGNFYAAKTITKQEVGSLHVNLDMLTSSDKTPIIAAGELQIIVGQPVRFNLLSGTYMAKKFEKLSNSDKTQYRNELVKTVITILGNLGISAQFLECSDNSCSPEERIGGKNIIETADIKTNNATLAELNTFFNRSYGGTRQRVIKHHKKTRKNRK
jgi:hypothetical protein